MSNDPSNITRAENEKQTTQVPAQELSKSELEKVAGGSPATALANIANLMHDMQKTIANNIRA